nr:13927_t:CDS:2 [Entrophospora candida]
MNNLSVQLLSSGIIDPDLHYGVHAKTWWFQASKNLSNICYWNPICVGMKTQFILTCYKSEVESNPTDAVSNLYQKIFQSSTRISGIKALGFESNDIVQELLLNIEFRIYSIQIERINLFIYGLDELLKEIKKNDPNDAWKGLGILNKHEGKKISGLNNNITSEIIQQERFYPEEIDQRKELYPENRRYEKEWKEFREGNPRENNKTHLIERKRNTCSNCNEEGHYFQDCPEVECGICRKKGHIKRFCPERICGICDKKGHLERDCKNQRIINDLGKEFSLENCKEISYEKDLKDHHSHKICNNCHKNIQRKEEKKLEYLQKEEKERIKRKNQEYETLEFAQKITKRYERKIKTLQMKSLRMLE